MIGGSVSLVDVDARESASALVGQILDERYRILRLLGEGGMGAVYEAQHIKLGGRLAIKVLKPGFAAHERERRRFLQEAQAAHRLKSDHVVRILDFGEGPTVFIAMELLEGIDSKELLASNGRLPWPRACKLVLQVLEALAEAHEAGIVHRDLKPSNIFVVEREGAGDFVKVLDFGIAKVAQPSGGGARLTRTNELIGTFEYMAPEQARARRVDARTDIYSLGIVLYEFLTGVTPFEGTNMYDIFDQHVRVSPKPPDELEPSIPAAVAAYVLRAIEKEPDHRFQSAEEFAAALRALPASDGPVRLATPVRARPRVDPVARVEAAAPTVTERSPAATERTGRPRRIAELTGLTAIGVFASAMLLRHLVSSPEPGIAVAPLELQALGPVAAGIAARGSLPLPRVEEPPRLAYDEAREDARKERIDAEERSVHRAARRPPKASNRRRPALSRDHHPAADTPPAVERRPLAEPPVAPTPVLAREAPEAPEVARTPPGAGPSDVEVVAALEKRVVDQCAGLDPGAKVWVEVEVTLDGRAYPEIHNVNPAARRCVRDVVRQANFQKGVSRAVEFTLVLR